uniref:Uncharacterized protein n=1 Tax=Eptatretus burgeri TaxID=7764 RepID=A0A8C4Q5C3_EPTBU
MSPELDWEFLMRLDPAKLEQHEHDVLQHQDVIVQLKRQQLQGEHSKNILQLFFITQFLLQLKVQESAMTLEELEKAGEEQAHTGNFGFFYHKRLFFFVFYYYADCVL